MSSIASPAGAESTVPTTAAAQLLEEDIDGARGTHPDDDNDEDFPSAPDATILPTPLLPSSSAPTPADGAEQPSAASASTTVKRIQLASLVKSVQRTVTLAGEPFSFLIEDRQPNCARGADDAFYAKVLDIWQALPRGCCSVTVVEEQTASTSLLASCPAVSSFHHELRGMRKFGFEDEIYGVDPLAESPFYREPRRSLGIQEVYMAKENGECMHVSAFKLPSAVSDATFIVCGSKNVHGVLRYSHFLQDLENPAYQPQGATTSNNDRYSFFREMAHTFYSVCLANPQVDVQAMLDHLVGTGHTFVAESCSPAHQHVVYYDKPQIRFFAVTSPKDASSGLTALNPVDATALFQSLGLQVVEKHHVVDLPLPSHDDGTRQRLAQVRNALRKSIELEPNSEGAVVYVISKAGEVVDVYKHKNYRYMALRAVREQISRCATNTALENRLRRLHFELEGLEEFIVWSKAFYSWVKTQVSLANPGVFSKIVHDTYVDLLTRFEAVPKSEWTFTEGGALLPADISSKLPSSAEAGLEPDIQRRFFMCGFPGSGKSMVGRSLARLLGGIHLNQDDFQGNTRAFLAAVANACQRSTPGRSPAVVLDKSHHTEKVRSASLAAASSPLTPRRPSPAAAPSAAPLPGLHIWLVMYHPDDVLSMSPRMEAMAEVCVERIRCRGTAHRTLFPTADNLEERVVRDNFQCQYEPISKREAGAATAVVYCDMTQSPEEILEHVVADLSSCGVTRVFSTGEISAAVAHARKCEDDLRLANEKSGWVGGGAVGKRPAATQYWCLKPVDPSAVQSHPQLRAFMAEHPEWQELSPLHVTLLYLGGQAEGGVEDAMFAVEGQQFTIQLSAMACNDRVCAAVVDAVPVACQNAVPHMTLALAKGAKPFEANAMLASTEHVRTVFEQPVLLEVVVKRVPV